MTDTAPTGASSKIHATVRGFRDQYANRPAGIVCSRISKILIEMKIVAGLTGLLLDSCRGGWKVKFASIPPAPDMARSALQPVFVVATKGSDDKCWLESTIRPSPRAPNAEQLADICQVTSARGFHHKQNTYQAAERISSSLLGILEPH